MIVTVSRLHAIRSHRALKRFNSVNRDAGYKEIEIYSPREVTRHECRVVRLAADVAVEAVETELNALLFPRLRKRLEGAAPKDREATADGRRLDRGRVVPRRPLDPRVHPRPRLADA